MACGKWSPFDANTVHGRGSTRFDVREHSRNERIERGAGSRFMSPFPYSASMEGQAPENTSAVDDHDAIVRTCQLYLEGGTKGDAGLLRRAFHSEVRVFGEGDGRRLDVAIDRFIRIACESPVGRGGRYRGRIFVVHQTGGAAFAVIAEDGWWSQVSFVDYMPLARVGSEWKIVAKTFAQTGGKMPA
jgi:Putative lumazine-binding